MSLSKALQTTRTSTALDYGYPSHRFVLRLLDRGETLAMLDHQGFDDESLLATLNAAYDRSELCSFYRYDLMFAYWLEDWEGALAAIPKCQLYLDESIGFDEVQQYWWFATLTGLAV